MRWFPIRQERGHSDRAWVALLLIRGVLLWLVVPIATLGWITSFAWLWGHGLTLTRTLGWADLNLVAALQQTVLRPWFSERQAWVPARDIPGVTHRLNWLDGA